MLSSSTCFSLTIVNVVSPGSWYITVVVDDVEKTTHVKKRKLAELSESRNQPTWCFRTSSRKFSLCLSRHGTSRVSKAPLELDLDLPVGKDVKRVLSFHKLETVITIELCVFSFGAQSSSSLHGLVVPRELSSPVLPGSAAREHGSSQGLIVPREQNPLLVSLVCDIKVLEVRGIEWKKHEIAQVVIQHAHSPPCYLSAENTKGKIAYPNADCTFFCDPSDLALKIALQDRRGETFKSARLPLDFAGVKGICFG